MKAEITLSQMYWNPSLLGFFFTKQAQNTLAELLNKAEDREIALEQIDSIADSWDMDADALGDMFHDMSVEELAKEFEIDMKEDDTDEEGEEE